MPSDRWREVLQILGDDVPLFALGAVALAALLLLLLFGRGGLRHQMELRVQRSLAHMRRREHGLPGPSDEALAMPLDPADVTLSRRLSVWLHSRDRLPMFVLGGAGLGLVVFAVLQLLGMGLVLSVAAGGLFGVGAPWWLKSHLRQKRLRRIASEFPAAVDTMVRGLRAGLPLIDCVRLIANEAEPNIAAEFRRTLNDYDIGVPVEQSLQRTAERLPLEEVRFFAVVVALQTQTGGRLAEMLDTLSDALRNRRALKDKVQVMSQEAKSSAAIIGALPLVVAGALFVVSPDYVSLLLNTTAGVVALLACGVWMVIGIQVMRGMIHFDA